MNYLYRKGRIVTITWSHGGNIVKVLARPGQFVFDNYTKDVRLLGEHEYIVSAKELRIEYMTEYVVAQQNTKPLPGMLVNDLHLVPSSIYERKLRKIGINQSPIYNTQEPEGIVNEVIAFKKLIYPYQRPRLVQIKQISNTQFPLFELSNGEVIERGSLKLFYRRSTSYEETYYNKKKRSKQTTSCSFQKSPIGEQVCVTT